MVTLTNEMHPAGMRDPRDRLMPARLGFGELLRVAAAGLRTRPLRAVLSAIGIAIGIAVLVSVAGIAGAGRADIDRKMAAVGTNLLTVAPGADLVGGPAHLSDDAVSMIERIEPVTSTTATGRVMGARVYRNDRIPASESTGISVLATKNDLPGTVGAAVASGVFLNDAIGEYPAVVLGADAAERLGVASADPRQQVWLGGEWFSVVGVLQPVPLAPELDDAALVGWSVARERLDFDGHPTRIYTRSMDQRVTDVQSVLGATANPENPDAVQVSRPSEALAANEAADRTMNGMLLGLGAIALLIGALAMANTMVLSVLERRGEIGLRRSLGATRGQLRAQFLTEASLLSGLGGVAGVLVGIGVTAGYALARQWPIAVPLWAMLGGVLATLVIGALAGLYPAVRAARLAPTEALAAS